MALWTVIHKTRLGTPFGAIRPENLQFTLNKGENGPHTISYEMSPLQIPAEQQIVDQEEYTVTYPQQTYPPGSIHILGDFRTIFGSRRGSSSARSTSVLVDNVLEPYASTFELRVDDFTVMAGPHTPLGITTEDDFIALSGKDYLHYLELRQYPFDPVNPNKYRIGDPARGLAMDYKNTDAMTIMQAIFAKVFAEKHSWKFSFDLHTTGNVTDFSLNLADTTTIYSMIQAFSQEAPGIFDFWVTKDKQFKMAVSRRYDIRVYTDKQYAAWTFSGSNSGVLKAEYNDNGPAGTHLLGLGAGDDVRLGLALDDEASQVKYGRIDGDIDFGDVPNRTRVNRLTQGEFGRFIRPDRPITLTVYPSAIPKFWEIIFPGCAIWLDIDMLVSKVNAAFEVVSMDANVTLEGDEDVKLNCIPVVPHYWETADHGLLGRGNVIALPKIVIGVPPSDSDWPFPFEPTPNLPPSHILD